MKCTNCGAEFLNGAQFCTNCGMRQPVASQQQATQGILKHNQYYSQIMSGTEKGWVIAFNIICFLTAFTCFPEMFVTRKLLFLADASIYFVAGILILLWKSWIASMLITGYAFVATLLCLTSGEAPKGVLALICGVKATMVLYKAAKAYREYHRQVIQGQRNQDVMAMQMSQGVYDRDGKRKKERTIAVAAHVQGKEAAQQQKTMIQKLIC